MSAPPNIHDTSARHQAISELHDAGAHFVLLEDKRPIWHAWQRRRPPAEVAQAHPGRLGLVPASIGTSALDVDHGDPRELLAHHPAWAVLPSWRPGGRHLYFRDGTPRRNSKWERYGCDGEIRSGSGYLVLWHDGAERLAEEIRAPHDGGRFPADLFEAAGVKLSTHHAPRKKGTAITPPRAVVLPMLEVVQEGGRNEALFDTVRHWAYTQDRGDSLEKWADGVHAYAATQNQRFPKPMTLDDGDRDEVRFIAWNVASWTWSGGGAFDHSTEAQRYRQGLQAQSRRQKNADRDRAILQDHIDGLSQCAIANRYGLARSTVQDIIKRDAPLFSMDGRVLGVLAKSDGESPTGTEGIRQTGTPGTVKE